MIDTKSIASSIRDIPAGEVIVFHCPKCGDDVFMPSLAFIEFGPPNLHKECGYSGDDMEAVRINE